MQLYQLRYFVSIVEAQSISKAAHRLNVTQPALSKALKNLENELEIVLLIRKANSVKPTPIGMEVYNDCKEILKIFDNTINNWLTQDLNNTVLKQLTVLSIPAFNKHLSNISSRLLILQPEIVLNIINVSPNDLLNHTFSNKALIAIGCWLNNEAENSVYSFALKHHYNLEPLISEPACLVLNPNHPLAAKELLEVSDLKNFSLVFTSYPQEQQTYTQYYCSLFRDCNVLRLNTPSGIFETIAKNNNFATIDTFLSAGDSTFFHDKQIGLRPIANFPLSFNHYLLYKNPDSLNDSEAVIVQLIKNYFNEFKLQFDR